MKKLLYDITHKSDGKYCSFKLSYAIAFIVITTGVILKIIHDDFGAELIGTYIGVVTGSSMVSKGLSMHQKKGE